MKARVIPSQREIALLYHLNETEAEGAAVREVLSRCHTEARELPEAALGQSVASFLAKAPPVPGTGEAYAGSVILLSGFESGRRQELLNALRAAGAGREAIKAVVTPTNRSWTFERLFHELQAEHASMTAPKAPEREGYNEI